MKRTCSLSNGGTFTVSAPGADWTCFEFEVLAAGYLERDEKQ